MAIDAQRYAGKPLLRLLELYVLWSIGHLSESDSRSLSAMTPKLQSVYRSGGLWQEVVSTAVNLPPNTPELIRGMWMKNLEIARQTNAVLTPQQFAVMWTDSFVSG